MDAVCDDIPVGGWNVQKDSSGTVSVIRNKMWPGFCSYHKANTKIYGGFYMGNGCKALDMPFMF
jgi:hypothetical protein